ncbi:hypothetical protein R5R35_002459 [Gryllus longicercus]|uniref:Uncharacterized protein n=1 Tax=Gryllus longicercus TaxID=2509291 RepID=A0AAN9VHZ6_9ORTH
MALTDAVVLLLPLLTLQSCIVRTRAEHVHGKRHPEHAGGLRTRAGRPPPVDPSVYIPSHFIQYPHPRFSPVLEILKQRQQMQVSGTLQSTSDTTSDPANVETGSSGHKSLVRRELQDKTRLLSVPRPPVLISNDLPSEHYVSHPIIRKLELDSYELEGLSSGDHISLTIPDGAAKSESFILSRPSRSMNLNEEKHLNSLEQSFPSFRSSSSLELSSSTGKQSSTTNNPSSSSNRILFSSSSAANKLISIPTEPSADHVTLPVNHSSPSEDRRSLTSNTPVLPSNSPPAAEDHVPLSSFPSSGHSATSNSTTSTRGDSHPAALSSPDRLPSLANSTSRVMEEGTVNEKVTISAKDTSPDDKNMLPDEIASKVLPSILPLMQALQSMMVGYGSTYETEFIPDMLPATHEEIPYAAAANTQYDVVHYRDQLDQMSKISPMTSFLFGGSGGGKKFPFLSAPKQGRILGYVEGFTV